MIIAMSELREINCGNCAKCPVVGVWEEELSGTNRKIEELSNTPPVRPEDVALKVARQIGNRFEIK